MMGCRPWRFHQNWLMMSFLDDVLINLDHHFYSRLLVDAVNNTVLLHWSCIDILLLLSIFGSHGGDVYITPNVLLIPCEGSTLPQLGQKSRVMTE